MTLRLRVGVSLADTDDGIALLDEDSGKYWSLNPTGALVLRALLSGSTPEQVAEDMTGDYAVDTDSALQDVHALVDELHQSKLVEW